MATTFELCKLLAFITIKESDLHNPDANVISDTVHFGFNLNVEGEKKKKVPQYREQLTEHPITSSFLSYP